jgi:phage terminase large subunit-like protein
VPKKLHSAGQPLTPTQRAALAGFVVDADKLARLPKDQREEATAHLAAMEAAFKANPLLGYQPHAKQWSFHLPSGPTNLKGDAVDPGWPPARLFLGGNRSGKTTATMVDSIIQAVDDDFVPSHLKAVKRWPAPFYCRVVIPDLTSTLEGVVLQKIREWCPRSQLLGGGFERAWDKMQRLLRFRNGSWIQFFSNDQDLDKFGGAALHRVVYDEEPRADIRRECLMRLIDYAGEELYGMTPLHGMSWVYDEFFAPWEAHELDEDSVRIVVVDMDDNPHLDRPTMRRVLAGLTPEEREARKSGRFVSFAGLIYPEWREGRFLRPSLEAIPDGAEVFCGIDPGYRFLCVVLWCYLTPDDDLVVFDEVAMPRSLVSQVVTEIKLRNQRWQITPRWYVIDPAARNKNTQTGRSEQQEFADFGIYTIPGQNAVTAGINRVRERLLNDRLHISSSCTELRAEFPKYRWVMDRHKTENSPPEKPVKRDDHALDCLRYIVMQRPMAPLEDTTAQTDTLKDRLLRHHLRKVFPKRIYADNGFGPGQYA